MPEIRERRKSASLLVLAPRWLEGLRDAIAKYDADASVQEDPLDAAIVHTAKHNVTMEEELRPDTQRHVAPHVSCKRGLACKPNACAHAILALLDEMAESADEIRAMAKAVAKVRDGLDRMRKEFEEALSRYRTVMQRRHAVHMEAAKMSFNLQHEILCRRPTLVREGLRHLVINIAGTDTSMLTQLPSIYRQPFRRKDHLFLLDLVTAPLLAAFRDEEIATLISDGGSSDGRIQRVSNRRLKRTKSRLQPGDKDHAGRRRV
jgi:hypothetical protein